MRKRAISISCIAALSLSLLAEAALSQAEKSKRPSPPANAMCNHAGHRITVDYSSPRMKGRKIFSEDGLAPFGKVWRAGANEATTFVTDADVTVGGKNVPVGSYTMFVIPNADKWTLIISKKTGEWGTEYPGEENDLARVDMKVSKLSDPMENFTISFDATGSGGCALRMEWETTRASVDVVFKK